MPRASLAACAAALAFLACTVPPCAADAATLAASRRHLLQGAGSSFWSDFTASAPPSNSPSPKPAPSTNYQVAPATRDDASSYTVGEAHTCTARGPPILACDEGLECVQGKQGQSTRRVTQGVCVPAGGNGTTAANTREVERMNMLRSPAVTIPLPPACPPPATTEAYGVCRGVRFGWDALGWSWDVVTDNRLDVFGYGGLPEVSNAPICGGPGGDLPPPACSCGRYDQGTCGYMKAHFTKGFGALSFKSATPVTNVRRASFRFQFSKDPSPQELKELCPEQMPFGPPTAMVTLMGETGAVMSNSIDLRQCWVAPSLGITAGCWAVFQFPVIEGDPKDEELLLKNPCTFVVPGKGPDGKAARLDQIQFKSSLDLPAHDAGCDLGDFYVTDLKFCSGAFSPPASTPPALPTRKAPAKVELPPTEEANELAEVQVEQQAGP